VTRQLEDEKGGLLSGVLRRWRVRAAAPLIAPPILDVGCGYTAPLAARCKPDEYVGVEIEPARLARAKEAFPTHRFVDAIPSGEQFRTVVALAVIEHVSDPDGFAAALVAATQSKGRIVISTPAPVGEVVHHAGARVGIFSRDASEEHDSVMSRDELLATFERAGAQPLRYRRFMFGMNQLAIFRVD